MQVGEAGGDWMIRSGSEGARRRPEAAGTERKRWKCKERRQEGQRFVEAAVEAVEAVDGCGSGRREWVRMKMGKRDSRGH